MNMQVKIDSSELVTDLHDDDALRVLRRLSEPGAVLALARDLDKAVIVRDLADGST